MKRQKTQKKAPLPTLRATALHTLHEHDGVAVVHRLDCPRCRMNSIAPELAGFVEEIATAEREDVSVEEITRRARALFNRISAVEEAAARALARVP